MDGLNYATKSQDIFKQQLLFLKLTVLPFLYWNKLSKNRY
jgi:hypothetical protein